MPSWIGPWEIAIVLVLALLIFGPRKLPDLGSSLGKSIRGFKKGLKETEDEVTTAVAEARDTSDVNPAEPQATPAQATTTAPAAPVAEAVAAAAVSMEQPAAEAALPLAEAVTEGPAEAVAAPAEAIASAEPAEAAAEKVASSTTEQSQ